jgi:hypothetical protein
VDEARASTSTSGEKNRTKQHAAPRGRIGGVGSPRSLSQVSTAASSDASARGRAKAIELVGKHAYSPADLGILARFLELQHLDGHNALAIDPPKEVLRLVLRAMKLLHLCDYLHEDVCCILAYTSVYLRSTYKACGHLMDSQEVANVVVAQMFIAHSYIQDATCPLRVWHEVIFQKYCSVQTLNAVIMRLIEIRGYRLRIDRKEMMRRYKYLCGSTTHILPNGGLPTANEKVSEKQKRSSGPSQISSDSSARVDQQGTEFLRISL